jgi:hypothetical protein
MREYIKARRLPGNHQCSFKVLYQRARGTLKGLREPTEKYLLAQGAGISRV